MKKGMFRRITAFVLALAMVISLMPTTAFAGGTRSEDKSQVTASKDGITVTKKAEFTSVGGKYVDANGNPYVKINFDVNVGQLDSELQVAGSTDIVLVIDKSGSMTTNGSKKMQNAKKAAKAFIGEVLDLDKEGAKVQVGIVAFSDKASNVASLSSDATSLQNKVDGISSKGGTFIQSGIYYGQKMLKDSTADNKIMIVLGDGLPTYRYEFYKSWGTENKKTESITDDNAYVSPYTAYTNFNYTKENVDYFDYGNTDNSWNSLSTSVKLGYEATISQAYLARKEIPGLSIYSIGYGIGSGKSAERIFKYIADDGKYSLAKNEDDLDGVISAITKRVTESIKGVTLTDKVPNQMDIVGEATTHADIKAKEVSGGIEFEWIKELASNTTYTSSFITTLDLSKLTAADFKNGAYFNTNGATVEIGGNGQNSSTLVYGATEDDKISLDSPQLQLDTDSYEVHYFYDGKEDTTQKVDTTYVWNIPNVADTVYDVLDKNKDKETYELNNVTVNNKSFEPTIHDNKLGAITIDENKVVNVYYKTIEKQDVVIKKVWNDNNNQDGLRNNITVSLLDSDGNYAKNFKGEVIGKDIQLTSANNWEYTLKDIRADEVYSVLEKSAVTGYEKVEVTSDTTKVNGKDVTTYTITNTHTPETCNVNVVVQWDDDDNRDGIRPDNVTVKLYKEVEGGEKTLVDTDSDVTTATSFTDLPVYENGKKITYTVVQEGVPQAYDTTPDHNDNGLDFKFINIYEPKTTSVTVKKNWVDGNNAENSRTDIVVQLLKNGTPMVGKKVTLTAANTYQATFSDLHENEGGEKITYTIQEVTVPTGYVPTYSDDKLTVTNTYKQKETTNVTVNKVWEDASDVDGLRPTSINVTLTATVSAGADAIADQTQTINGTSNNWSYTFENLKAYDSKGAKIKYTVVENTRINGYTTKYENNGTNTVTITNAHTPETKDVTVNKVWSGDSKVASIVRPENVTLKLYANGTAVKDGEVLVTGSDNDATWTYTFKDLPVNHLDNGKSKAIVYTVDEISTPAIAHYNKSLSGLTVTNTYEPIMITHTVTKVWDDNDNHDGKRPDEITVTLYGKTNTKDKYKVETKSFGEDKENGWTYTFNNLPLYNEDGEEITYSAEETRVAGYEAPTYDEDTTDAVTTITNTRKNEVIDYTVTKNWDDDSNRDGIRPGSIKVELLKNGQVVAGADKTLSGEDNTWTATWKDLELYTPNIEGGAIENVYTVREVLPESVDAKYDTTVDYAADGKSATITNTHAVDKKSLTVTKSWNDNNNQDGMRTPSVTVKLYADGKVADVDDNTVTLSAANNWTYTWTKMYVNEGGSDITYTVKEENVPSGYTSNTSSNNGLGFTKDSATVVNTHTPEKIKLTINKVWDDENNAAGERPNKVTVNLMNGETVVKEIELSKDNSWIKEVTVDKYVGGKQVTYTLDEVSKVSGYTVSYSEGIVGEDGTLEVTNTYNVEKTNFTVTKAWNDNNNQDGYRTSKISVQLYAKVGNNNPVGYGKPVELTSTDNWTYTWSGLETSRDGVVTTYSVKEVAVPEHYKSDAFETAVSFNDNNEAVITNSHNIETIEHTVEKVWEDDNNNDRIRPDSITVQLYAKYGDAEAVEVEGKTLTLNASNNWTAKWTGLDKKAAGEDIIYSAKEVEVPAEYEVSYNTDQEAKKTVITNTHVNRKTSFKVVKEWVDSDNNDRIRPNSIKVQLFADGKAFGDEVELNANNNWSYEWKTLTKLNKGNEIKYTVDEIGVPTGYTKKISDIQGGQKITNTHENEETSHTVTKVWEDSNNNDNYRPTSILVELYADDVATGNRVSLDANNQWTYTWTELTKLKEGTEIKYSAKEVEVPDNYDVKYNTVDNSTTITNTHAKDQITLTIVKNWVGDEVVADKRPENIEVNLYEDGKFKQTVTLEKSKNWTATVKVDRFNAKKLVEYTVKEATFISGYSVSYSGAVKDVNSTLTVTNTYNVEYANFTVTKSWLDADNQDGIRPTAVSVQLYKDGVGYGEPQVLNTSNSWTYTWPSLEIERDGQAITYTVEEVTVPTGYTSNTERGAIGFDENNGSYQAIVTNTHAVDKTAFKVVKVWDDNNNNDGYRPASVKVQLKANNVEVSEENGRIVELNETNNWTYVWNNLDKKAAGTDIKYTVVELDVPNEYQSTVTDLENDLGQKITNTHTKDQITLTIKKDWIGDEVVADKRPTSITVDVYAKVEGEEEATKVETVTLEKSKNWTTTLDVDRYKNKELISYTVKEATFVSGYTVSYSGAVNNVDSTLTVTNTYNVEYANFTVTKSWIDANNQDGYRTPSVNVQLYKNGIGYGEPVVLNDANNWTYTWNNLETTRDNKNNIYTVQETIVPEEYISNTEESPIRFIENEDNNYSITVVNTHTIEKTEHSVVKVWDDQDDNDRVRPENITVQLYAKYGEAEPVKVEGKTMTLDADNNWSGKWTDLDKKASGEDIVYTAKEVDLNEAVYAASYSTEGTVTTITNTHENELTSFKVLKVWEDDNNNDGYRPESVQVQLYSMVGDEEAKPYGEVVTLEDTDNEDTKWTYTWNNLTKYKDGVEITYYVEEVNVPDEYQSEVTDLDKETELGTEAKLGQKITNTHKKDQITLTINKEWLGDTEEVNERPESVTVDLYADDVKKDTITLSPSEEQGNVWTATIDVDRYNKRELITYTVKEVTFVSGYTATYSEAVNDVDSALTVTNTYNVVTEDFTVTKQWIDNNNQDGIRPEAIQVELSSVTEDGDIVVYEELATLDETNNWTYTWTGLETSRDGKETTYFVREASMVDEYESDSFETAVAFDENNRVVITNTHEPYKKDVTVKFNWDDLDDIEGVRTDKMIANLYKVVSGDINDVLGSDNESGDKPSDEDEEIVDANTGVVIGYALTDDDTDADTDTDSELVKELIDSKEVTNDTWFVTFENVPVYENGKEIVYLVLQDALPNAGEKDEYTYVSTVNTSEDADFVITNKYRPSINKDITVIWDDENNTNNIRPDEVIIQATVDGTNYGDPIKITVEDVKEDDSNTWTGKTSDLPKYTEDGKEIVYRVVQSNVVSYETTYSEDSFTITNKYRKPYLNVEEQEEIIIVDDKDKNNNNNQVLTPVVTEQKEAKDTKDISKVDKTPKTYDAYDMSRYIWMLVLSAMGILVMMNLKKKEA